MKKSVVNLFILFFIVSMFSCVPLPRNGGRRPLGGGMNGMPTQPGKCYSKCMLPTKHMERFPIYNGENGASNSVSDIQIVTKSASSGWVKKPSPNPCQSRDPKDCMIWCKDDTPEESINLTIVMDTLKEHNYVWKEYNVANLDGGPDSDWREVICYPISKRIYKKIEQSLLSIGYLSPDMEHSEESIQKSIISFQKDNNLAIGAITVEVLNYLGINY